MKFLILALATIAVASASLFGGKTVNVLDDGTIVVRTEFGKQIIIGKKIGPAGEHLTEIDITGPFSTGKKIQIDENNLVKVSPGTGTLGMNMADMMDRLKRSPKVPTAASQADALAEIEKEFQGIINEAGYEKLLAKVQKSATKGKIDSTVVDYLQSLAETAPWHTVANTAATTGTTQVQQYPTVNTQDFMGARPMPWYMCNDITCFKQMMMMNSMAQKAPMMTYDQYMMKKDMINNMRMNPMYYGQNMYPGFNQFYPIRGAYDNSMVNNDLAAKKNFWTSYMNRLNMNSFAPQYDEQQQLPVNREVVDNKMFY